MFVKCVHIFLQTYFGFGFIGVLRHMQRYFSPYPQRDRKRRLNGAVSESPYKKGGPVSVLRRAR